MQNYKNCEPTTRVFLAVKVQIEKLTIKCKFDPANFFWPIEY